MIIRILNEGQFDVDDQHLGALNQLDESLTDAIQANELAAFERVLHDLLAAVRSYGSPLADEELLPSELVLPPGDASISDVQQMLADDGLIPG